MYKYDLNTGEPSYDGSPPSSSISEQEIINNANLAVSYDIDPQQRFYDQQMRQNWYQGYYNPAMQGFNQNYYGNAFMNQPTYQQQSGFGGYAGAPYYQGGYPQQQGYGFYQQPYNYSYQNPYYQPQQPRDYTYYVPPYNMVGSGYLYQSNAMDELEDLIIDTQRRMEESYVKRYAKQREYYNSIGYGCYSSNVNRIDPIIQNEFDKKVHEMTDKARDAQSRLNKGLSRMCAYYLNDGEVDEEKVEDLYEGHVVTVPATQVQQTQDYNRFANSYPEDTSIPYKMHYARVSAEYQKYFNNDTDMETFFNNVGQVITNEIMEDEYARRRSNLGELYQGGSDYRSLIRENLYKKYANGEQGGGGFRIPNINGTNIPGGGLVPTLDQAARILDDGTLSIRAPEWLGTDANIHINAEEDQYEIQRRKFASQQELLDQEHRSKFVESIYRDNPRPTGPPIVNEQGGGGTGGS